MGWSLKRNQNAQSLGALMIVDPVDIAVLGAGPAGMAAAVVAANAGLSVTVLDDQTTPGGQIWRNIEAVSDRADLALFGEDYAAGIPAVAAFRASAAEYRPLSRVIGVEPSDDGCDVLYVAEGKASRLRARRLIIALGAYERPMPFKGWTMPGVMTAGAAQIALKTGGLVPEGRFVLAGQGPLLLLLANQFLAAGAKPSVLLRLDDPFRKASAVLHLPKALAGRDDLAKGLEWQRTVHRSIGTVVSNVTEISVDGVASVDKVRWRTASGKSGVVAANMLLVHDGVIPNAQLTRALRAPHHYNKRAAAWTPNTDASGKLAGTEGIYVAGDNAGILGWSAATATGAAAGQAAAASLGKTVPASEISHSLLRKARAVRPLLDALYPPARAFRKIDDDVTVCRCEAVQAGDVRKALALGAQGPNQIKAFLRTGMGACQGRMCAVTIAALTAEAHRCPVGKVELMRVRMPISPVTVAEISHLNETDMDLPVA